MYTTYGYKNFKNWLNSDKLKNISAKRSEKDTKILTRLAILNLMHPFQSFIFGQKNFPIRVALKYKIPLIIAKYYNVGINTFTSTLSPFRALKLLTHSFSALSSQYFFDVHHESFHQPTILHAIPTYQ